MTLALHRSDYFKEDFDLQYRWYLRKAGEEVAERYLAAVSFTLNSLAQQPAMGVRRNFHHSALKDIRAFRVRPPFDAHLIFYRHTETELVVERIMRASRDLPRRLVEPPGSGED